MEVVYFAKDCPGTPIWLPNGRKLQFDTVDGVSGYTLTADPGMIATLRNFIARHVGGMREVPQAEYEAFISKKKSGEKPPKPWREEVRPSPYAQDAVNVDAVGGKIGPRLPAQHNTRIATGIPTATKPTVVPEKPTASAEPVAVDFKPKTTSRKARAKAK